MMNKVSDDEVDLAKLENHIREEFEEIDDEVEALGKKVDEVTEEKKEEKKAVGVK